MEYEDDRSGDAGDNGDDDHSRDGDESDDVGDCDRVDNDHVYDGYADDLTMMTARTMANMVLCDDIVSRMYCNDSNNVT